MRTDSDNAVWIVIAKAAGDVCPCAACCNIFCVLIHINAGNADRSGNSLIVRLGIICTCRCAQVSITGRINKTGRAYYRNTGMIRDGYCFEPSTIDNRTGHHRIEVNIHTRFCDHTVRHKLINFRINCRADGVILVVFAHFAVARTTALFRHAVNEF